MKVVELNKNKIYKRFLPFIHLEWIEISPSKEEILRYIEECLMEGIESLKVVKSWIRNEPFLPCINTLEEWDVVIGGKWR